MTPVYFIAATADSYDALVPEHREQLDSIFSKGLWYPQWATFQNLKPGSLVVLGHLARNPEKADTWGWGNSYVERLCQLVVLARELGCVELNL